MDDTLTIHTSDNATVTVKRVHLLANSSVFADMMASASGSSVDLVETEEQLKAFLDALGGELGAFEELGEEGLENFARLADKYDSETARESVRRMIWEFDSKKEHALSAFGLSTILNDVGLIQRTVFPAHARGSDHPAAPRISTEWESRITRWREQLRQHALTIYLLVPYPLTNGDICGQEVGSHTCAPRGSTRAWQEIGKEMARPETFDFPSPFVAATDRVCARSLRLHCYIHEKHFRDDARKYENEYFASLPDIFNA